MEDILQKELSKKHESIENNTVIMDFINNIYNRGYLNLLYNT